MSNVYAIVYWLAQPIINWAKMLHIQVNTFIYRQFSIKKNTCH